MIRGAERTVIGAVGSSGRRGELEALQAAPGVEALVPISQPFKLVSRQLHQERTRGGRGRRDDRRRAARW